MEVLMDAFNTVTEVSCGVTNAKMPIVMNSKPPQCGVQHVFRVLVAVLMAKSCTKKHAMPQVADELHSALNDLVVGLNTRKKVKMLPSSDNTKTQAIARVSPVEVATTHKPRNPLAPPSDKQLPQWKTCPLNGRAEEKVPIPGSQYGFHLPSPTADSATSCSDSTVPCHIPVSRGGTPTNPKVTVLAPPIPLRSSQIVQHAYNSQTCQLSRTFSVHDLNTTSQPQNFFDQDVSVPVLLPYYHAGEDSDTDFPSQCGKFPISGDTDIDNVSPDEDERMAEAVLHTPDLRSQGVNFHSVHSHASTPELEQQYGEDLDIVHAYHQCNGFLHVPALERLHAICDQQQPSSGITISMPGQDVACGVAQSSQLSPESTGPLMMVLLTADGELMGHLTKHCSYPNKFQEVIEQVKLIAQCDSAMKNPFPSHSTFLDIMSGEIFNEALVECMNTPAGYWPNYHSQLGILLLESLMMWQLMIKAKACEVLPQFYDVGAHCTEAENQLQSQTLIKGAMFLRDGVDNEGSTNNMVHPALAALVMDFFYSSSSIGTVFPEVFSHEVPRVALRAALDEYTQTGIQQDCPFEYGTYSKIFVGFLDMQHQIDQHPRHAAKTQELQVAWTSAGRMKTHLQPVIAFSDEFHIILD
ncbi:hypothetical protein EDD17DRAFT_1509416 [Pisolithus thermaeus]|nr:hypothetical protein EDD17DRAFT_1509416 [Pisolithus thermaeus]